MNGFQMPSEKGQSDKDRPRSSLQIGNLFQADGQTTAELITLWPTVNKIVLDTEVLLCLEGPIQVVRVMQDRQL